MMDDETERATANRAVTLWCEGPMTYGLRATSLLPPPDGHVRVKSHHTAVSRGTERLVLEGRVPPAVASDMQAPHQAGRFPFPVAYGYALAGEIVAGPAGSPATRVFALHPHASAATLARAACHLVPDRVPLRRATLAANMETALTVCWDSGAGPGDRIAIMGAGTVGLLVARLMARVPGTEVTLVDRLGSREAVANAMGAAFAKPDALSGPFDVVINATGSGEALALALEVAGTEATIVEAGWHGSDVAHVPLGGLFHSERLKIVSSQVGRIPSSRRARWTHGRRLAKALSLLDDAVLDRLLTHEVPYADAPAVLPRLITADDTALTITLRWPAADASRSV